MKKFSKQLTELQNEMTNAILAAMAEKNVSYVSLFDNGSHSDFDVATPYAMTNREDGYIITPTAVEVVAIIRQSDNLYIIVNEDNLSIELIDNLEQFRFLANGETLQNIINLARKDNALIEPSCTECFTDLLSVMCDTIEDCMDMLSEPIADNMINE